jgi:lipoyl(octanoyl) transferase
MLAEVNSLEAPPLMALQLIDLGSIDYELCWKFQKELQHKLIAGEIAPTLLTCSHPAVITLGKGTREENLKLGLDEIESRGIKVFRVERGGDVTYHGTGQIVLYPILNLSFLRKDVDWYMRSLEQVMIDTLAFFEIEAGRIPGKTGVWIRHAEGERKIGSIGVRLSRWCSMHGLALNIDECKQGFSLIHPCGMKNVEVTSIREELAPQHPLLKISGADQICAMVKPIIINRFMNVFGYTSAGA